MVLAGMNGATGSSGGEWDEFAWVRLRDRCLAGDEAAWNELVAEMYPVILACYRSMAHDRDLAEDLAQSFFLKLLEDDMRRLRVFDPIRNVPFRAYLHVVASNLYRDWLRSREAIDRKRWVTLDGFGDLLTTPQTTEQEGAVLEISGLMKSLPPRERIALELLAGGASYKSIAGVVGLTSDGVGTLIFRARARLRELVGKRE